MKYIPQIIILSLSVLSISSCSKGLQAPDGALSAVVSGQEITVFHGQKQDDSTPALKMHVGLISSEDDFDSSLELKKVSASRSVHEDYTMVSGKRKHCVNDATERTYIYQNQDGKKMELVLRLYNDGIAVRYVLPAGTEIVEDRTAYIIPDGTKRWISPLKTDYEAFFPSATDGAPTTERMWPRPEPGRWAYPALYQPSDDTFVLISEADLRHGHSASSLDNSADPERYLVHLTGTSILEDGQSPWRMAIVGGLSDIVESTLVTDLCPAPAFEADWVKPGVSSWVYWAYNHGSKDFQTNKSFIDLAAEMGWPYCLVDWEWPQMEGGDIEGVLDYAKQKGVKINLWYNSGTSWIGDGAPQPQDRIVDKANREQEMQWLEEHGVSGIKVDFFLPDDADMIDYYLDILEDAARHKLTVDFHGCTIPRGWQRTWPNMVSMESVYGAEWYNNGPAMTTRAASHNATIPFTRNVIGPMDYTPGTFSDSQFPHITTYAHELALPVLFESGLQHMPDRPDVYAALPEEVRGLLSGLPAAWDETLLLAGYPGESAVIARRAGGRWYIAGVNGLDKPADLQFSLERLGISGGKMQLFADKAAGADTDGNEDRAFRMESVVPGPSMTVPCRARGGFVLVTE